MDPHACLTPHAGLILRQWDFFATTACRSVVLPDGCRDLILLRPAQGEPSWFVSPLADTAYPVASAAGQAYIGLRFHPAARIDAPRLLAALRARDGSALPWDAVAPLVEAVHDHVHLDARIVEALTALSECTSVAAARRRLGVGARSMERLLAAGTGRPPGYWRGLARIRRAARDLSGNQTLAEIAADHGYADQAHMNRAFRAWFGCSPGRFRIAPDLRALAAEPGYD